jgi:hypothetical protein
MEERWQEGCDRIPFLRWSNSTTEIQTTDFRLWNAKVKPMFESHNRFELSRLH